MSGASVGRAIHERFDAVRRAEVERLKRKLSALNDAERAIAEQVIADVVAGLARVPSRYANAADERALRAIVHLFGLDIAQ
jgi:glutamyl-tRNA reductase